MILMLLEYAMNWRVQDAQMIWLAITIQPQRIAMEAAHIPVAQM
jgi:hypothetical protein